MRLPYGKFFQTDESSDAVFQMDDQIAFGELAEIDLGAVTFGASNPQEPSWMNCESSEQLRSRENDKISCRKAKSARKRALHKIQAFNRAAHDFAKAFNLAFSMKINYDPGVVCAPFLQARYELSASCLRDHYIAGAKLADLAILKRATEIFRTTFNPAFANLDLRA
jgi:hypothetical protein